MSEPTGEGPRFEEALEALERIVEVLEDGRLGLDDALSRYEEGVSLIRLCQERLLQAEQRVLLVSRIDNDGQPSMQPFKHEATAGPAPAPRPRRKDE
jgi:exodeoxyribonuclease VII small subunit